MSIEREKLMLKYYLKIAFRNIKNHKSFAFINVTGLAVGMTCAMLILLWVKDELNYDRFHQNIEQICRVVGEYDGLRTPTTAGSTTCTKPIKKRGRFLPVFPY